MSMNKKRLEELYLRHLNGEQPGEIEMNEVLEWIAKDERNKNYLERLYIATKAKTLSEQLKSVDVDKNWIRFRDTISRKTLEGADYSFTRNTRLTLLRIAAAAIFLAAAVGILYFVKSQSYFSIQQVSSASQGTEVKLSDGSIVLLNKGSVLTFPKKLHRKKREVKLSGEAYFNVARKKNFPFHVYLDRLTLQVLGTSFNIKEAENGNTVVSVLDGKVAFYEKNNRDNSMQLSAGQKGTFNASTKEFRQDTIDKDFTFFWDQTKLNFKHQSLEVVFKELEKTFHKRFVIADKDILGNKFTSDCKGADLVEILNEMSILFKIQYDIKGDTVYIQKTLNENFNRTHTDRMD
jgi:transmembrane sensor